MLRASLSLAMRAPAMRATALKAAPRALAAQQQQVRGLKTLDFGGTKEDVIERSDYPKAKFQEMYKNDTLLMMGYGTQGRGQALNLRDNGMPVIVGVRKGGKGSSWEVAVADGWIPGKNLFELDESLEKATVYMFLLSDAGQKAYWPKLKPHLTKGKTLYVAHGFSFVFEKDTQVTAPAGVDVILVAPKGSGTTVRNLFLEGRGINGSVAVLQDATGKATDKAYGLGVAVGCGYLYGTTFQKETYSDLVGERGVLMGMVQGAFQAQYEVLRAKGHSPSEAFNETVEEATQSLWPLVGAKGMDWMFGNCSTTAQRGALDWAPRFHTALKPVFQKLYDEVENGNECRRTLDVNSKPDYKASLEKELDALRQSEMWKAGNTVRKLRPENQ